ncbi:hypothetical protein RFI_18316 [Reticulomyxa filosa]|uniref:Telomerase reverse transcriptase n=1 Tax=Reticulomyxa filosa TaxID=46433 RepID=X6MZ81_RETFI|nr:hypothetical protein RFI_18316 [Reticulomyxa filosa]|eukprot:ETO18928.1 hypothetical protein RFI_18316 [Reticulomyxa filosa]
MIPFFKRVLARYHSVNWFTFSWLLNDNATNQPNATSSFNTRSKINKERGQIKTYDQGESASIQISTERSTKQNEETRVCMNKMTEEQWMSLLKRPKTFATVVTFVIRFLQRVFPHNGSPYSNHLGLGWYNVKLLFKCSKCKKKTIRIFNIIKKKIVVCFVRNKVLDQFIHAPRHRRYALRDSLQFMSTLDFMLFRCFSRDKNEQATKGITITYYPSHIWNKIVGWHVAHNNMFVKLSKAKVWELTQQKEAHAVGYLRFLPKKTTLRPIVNLRRTTVLQKKDHFTNKVTTRRLEPANYKLRECFAALNYEVENFDQKTRNEKCLGFTTLSVKEYYDKWKHFVLTIKKHYPSPETMPKLYCVALDFAKCYDRINQDTMLQLLDKLILRSERYSLVQYATCYPELGIIGQSKAWRTYAVNCKSVQNLAKSCALRRGPFILQHTGPNIIKTRTQVFDILRYHITNSIVNFDCEQLNGVYYQHKVGVSQGSIVSQLLCCIYIGFVEREVLCPAIVQAGEEERKQRQAELEREKDNADRPCSGGHDLTKPTLRLLMRHVDDCIFFTTSKQEATVFAKMLHSGIAHYHVMANPEKTSANFELEGIDPSHISSH